VAGLSHLAASGSSIISLTGAALVSAATFAASGSADLQTAALIGLPSIAGARVGVLVARRLPPDVHALCFNGLSTLMLPAHLFIQRSRQQQDGAATSGRTVPRALHAAFGCVSGFVSAIMGVGGGPLLMSYLTLATPLSHHLVQGTAACAVAPGMVAAALSHLHAGTVPIGIASLVTAGAALGAVGGTRVALWLSEEQLRTIYMASLALLGGRAFIAAGGNLVSIARRWRASRPKGA